ncbi:hypothetical protein MJH12_16065, partial [bacterium]|nr:hypothetical protein [bacterium]
MKQSIPFQQFLLPFILSTLFLAGCGGGGSSSSTGGTTNPTTPIVNSTFISGTYNFQSSSNSLLKFSVQKASSVLSNDYE